MDCPPHTGRRNPLQEEQRLHTRQAIMTAALAAFGEHGFAACSVEQILMRAGVSRAAFYAHFDSKLSLVCAIAEDFEPQWRPTFDHLSALEAPTLDDLAAWARIHLAFHREHQLVCGLLSQLVVLEDRLYWQVARQRDALIAMLGRAHPAFARATQSPKAHLRAAMLLWSIDQTCFHVVRGRLPDPDDGAAGIIAAQLHAFLNETAG